MASRSRRARSLGLFHTRERAGLEGTGSCSEFAEGSTCVDCADNTGQMTLAALLRNCLIQGTLSAVSRIASPRATPERLLPCNLTIIAVHRNVVTPGLLCNCSVRE